LGLFIVPPKVDRVGTSCPGFDESDRRLLGRRRKRAKNASAQGEHSLYFYGAIRSYPISLIRTA
jgi:hypothetical protein